MPITNYVPSSRLIQPGVIDDSSKRPSSPYQGQVIFEKDTKQTLIWSGSSWVMLSDADTPPGLELIKTFSIGTAVLEAEVTGAFSSSWDDYLVVISGMSTSAANAALRLIMGSTITGYYNNGYYTSYASNTLNGNGNNNASAWFEISFTESGAVPLTYSFNLYGPNLAQQTRVNSSWSTSSYTGVMNGILTNTTQYTSFKINAVGGSGTNTLTGGTIRVYGYRKSI